ncbi:MAG: superoxide dismutase family protein, partial [Candidatus Hodarchaeota archaeon]
GGEGAAVVVHEKPDDYTSDPAGDAGPRIACGVITK